MHNLVSDLGATMLDSGHMLGSHQDFFVQMPDAVSPDTVGRTSSSLKRKFHEIEPQHGLPDKYAKLNSPKYTELVHQTCLDANPNDTIEYVLFDDTFLPITHNDGGGGGHHQTATNYMQYSLVDSTVDSPGQPHRTTADATNTTCGDGWVNVDLLDLDQRQWFFEETTPSANSSIQSEATSTGSANVSLDSTRTVSTADFGSGNSRSTDGDIFCYIQPGGDGTATASRGQQGMTKSVPTPNEDYEDKNLSWLFNFKLDELPHLSPEVERSPAQRSRSGISLKLDEIIKEATSADLPASDDDRLRAIDLHHNSDPSAQQLQTIVDEQQPPTVSKKPPFTYTELIEYALEDKSELTVSGIYTWISDRFPYYKSNDDRWKNSVRHNLSINPHFRKGSKAAQGAGHLWTISTRDSDANILAWEHKKQRFDLFFKMEKIHMENQRLPSVSEPEPVDEAAIAAANIEFIDTSNSMSPQSQGISNEHTATSYNIFDELNADDLRRSAGEILNGVRRTVEVQVISPADNLFPVDGLLLDSDYLNPVSKDQIVRECGLRSHRAGTEMHQYGGGLGAIDHGASGNEYYVTDIDPISLGVHMNHTSHHHHHVEDEEVLFGDDFNLNYFGMVSGSNIMT